MIKLLYCLVLLISAFAVNAQSPVGKWKVLTHTVEMEGSKIDMHAALLQRRPCAAKVVYEINADASYRLNASASGCDESYVSMQEKLYSKTQWRLTGNQIMISATNFEIGQTYSVSFSGDKMTWIGTEGQGTIVYQRL
jgi:hypothetical protein